MSNQTARIIRKAINKKEKYNILTFDTHERYQTQLAKTGHNFYSFRYQGCKTWNETFSKLPDNYYILPENVLYKSIDFDFILSQSKFGQFQIAKKIQQDFKLPIVSLEHTLPIDSWPDEQLKAFRSMSGDINVFISKYSKDIWDIDQDADIIHHSVDTDLFKPNHNIQKNATVLSVVNDFKNRDYCCNYSGWERITKGLPVKLVGDSPGLSKPAESVEELAREYQSTQVFLNTSTISPVPTALLEAMACGCAVVSTATCMIPEIIVNGVNGFISNDEEELAEYIKMILDSSYLRERLGVEARKTILEKFSEDEFVSSWNKIFDRAYGV